MNPPPVRHMMIDLQAVGFPLTSLNLCPLAFSGVSLLFFMQSPYYHS